MTNKRLITLSERPPYPRLREHSIMANRVARLFARPPKSCGSRMVRCQTKSNRNGNRGRYFYKCNKKCRKMVFDDWEGIRKGNPRCSCGRLSRGQFERESYVFRCARKECEYKVYQDNE
ncbi:hypothetical protein BJX99DRAFT_240419 [Aspergillus californicus]